MPHIGLDISYSTIRYIELTKESGKFKIKKHGIKKLNTPVVIGQPLATNTDLEKSLIEIQKSNKINFVEVSIPEVQAYLYTAEVPEGDEESIMTNIELHLEENAPLTINEAVFEYFPVRRNKQKGTVTVAVSVVPYQIVKDYINLLEKCNMTPVSFLIENQALSRSVINSNDSSLYMLVQISERRTGFSIVSDHAVQFTSSIQLGSVDFTNNLAKELKISVEEAEKLKYSSKNGENCGNCDDNDDNKVVLEEDKIFMSMINSFSTLKDEIQRVCIYWQSMQENLKLPIKKIILSGRDATLPGLQEYFSADLNLPVDIANVWQNIFDLNETVPEIEFCDALDFGTAIGLALPKKIYS
jgi:type IV pilus assembly protein PilM